MNKYTLWFDEVDRSSINIVGGKGANLGEMSQAGLPVPPGFCITTKAYKVHFQPSSALQENIAGSSWTTAIEEKCVEEFSQKVQDEIRNRPMMEEVRKEILACYSELTPHGASDPDNLLRVSVRSSATAEDLPEASFAGQQSTFLNVIGEEQLITQIKNCWASLWSPRSIQYREQMGFDHDRVFAAIVVQIMIDSEVSGVMFTANPISGNRSEAVINASWGLGEAIVSGQVSPDTLILSKQSGKLLSEEIGSKEITYQFDHPAGIKEIPTPTAKKSIPALSDDDSHRLLELAEGIESHYRQPQDIEWAIADRTLYLLQTRPITTLEKVVEKEIRFPELNRTMFIELFPDALSPIFASVMHKLIGSMLDYTLKAWGFKPVEDQEAVQIHYHQPYFNREYIERALASLPERQRSKIVGQIMNPFSRQERSLDLSLSFAYLRMLVRTFRFMLRFPKELSQILEQYRDEVETFQRSDPSQLSDAEIAGQIRQMVFGTSDRLLSIDFLMIVVIGVAYQILGTFLEKIVGENAEMIRAKLISGVSGNVTMETNIRLWDLSQIATTSASVSEMIKSNEPNAIQTQLATISEGREFLIALDAFLKEYGHREIRLDIMYPTWGEDPTPVFGFIRAYLDLDPDHSPYRNQARLDSEREQALQMIEEKLQNMGSMRYILGPIFSRFLKLAQVNTRERDTIHFELTRLFPTCRKYLKILGERWVEAGWILEVEDVYFLRFEEMEAQAAAPSNKKELIEERRRIFELDQNWTPPDIIRGEEEIYLQEVLSEDKKVTKLSGIAGSPGKAEGIVRVISDPSEFNKLTEGDVLVAPLTTPVWTPLFAIANAVVTDTGGILSHGAIVAREFGIPAVLSVPGATQVLQDGQFVRVDGESGIVSLG